MRWKTAFLAAESTEEDRVGKGLSQKSGCGTKYPQKLFPSFLSLKAYITLILKFTSGLVLRMFFGERHLHGIKEYERIFFGGVGI